ncbi:hypothetical protein [uncultured Weissella sp.]|uniref:hypothetical protein n=1 Tax=uncultured Weissella sp. TaxID=253243 RepID=UPI00258C57DD|nr:hypothetical protein [uncultured Weissella sp.]
MDKKTLLSILTEAKQEMNDILEDETHLPSQYIAMGLKAGITAVLFRLKRNQLEELPIDVVKRYNKAKQVTLKLHPMMNETSVSDFDNGFQLASRALIDVITNDKQLSDKTKLNILDRMNDQLTALGKVD